MGRRPRGITSQVGPRQSTGRPEAGKWPDPRKGAAISVPFPEPTAPAGSRAEVFLRYLDYFRSRLAAKLESLPAAELARSRLPSGWPPLELAKPLRYVELRWLEWGL